MTPDAGFRIVGMAARPDVLMASPCSGHGFKFTVLMGRIAAWEATGEPVPWDLSRFALSRFD